MEKNKKLDLILDFNNLAMRALFTCQFAESNVDIGNFDTDAECDVLVRKVASDVSYIIRTFSPDRTIFACDSRFPWRNGLYDGIDGRYKGTREHDETKNWTKIFSALDDFKSILKSNGFVVTELDNTEADDIAALWKEKLINDDENVILVSSDKDWTQLVSFDDASKVFCVCFNPTINTKKQRKLFVTESMKRWLEEPEHVDIFFTNYNVMKQKINHAVSSDSRIVVESIVPERVVLEKIMCGDDGDNVPAFFDYYRNGKKNRVTPLKAGHVFESLHINTVDDLVKANEEHLLKDALEKEMKRDVDVDFDVRLLRQRRLVELNSVLFPKEIVERFNEHSVEMEGIGHVDAISSMKMDSLLKGTRYIDDEYHKKVKESAIFNDFKSLTGLNKPGKLF